MDIEIKVEPIRFQLHGLFADVANHQYGEVGCRIMDQLWKIVKRDNMSTTGIIHWVYLDNDRMFVGIELLDKMASANADLSEYDFQLKRYAEFLHVGPYQQLPQVWQSLKSQLTEQGERVTMPSLEVYGHASVDADTPPETTILIGLRG